MYGCSVARNHFHWSTFSFSESRTTFSFASKRKSGFTRRGYAPSVRRRSRQRLGCGPSWAGKNQRKVKTSRFPTKEKAVLPAGGTPHPRRHSTHRARAVSKRHSRQETACHQRPGDGPCRAGKNQRKVKTSHFPTKEKAVSPPKVTPHP